jgi:hypothetical protein
LLLGIIFSEAIRNQQAHRPCTEGVSIFFLLYAQAGLGMVLAVTLRKRYGTVWRGNVHFGTVTFRNVTLAQLGNPPFLLIFIDQNNTRYNSLLKNYKFLFLRLKNK